MKQLIIAEKPELGRAVAEALIPGAKEKNGVIENDAYCITWAYGHLLELAGPEKYDEKYSDRNDISLLPIYFDNWKKIPPTDKVVFGKKVDNAYRRGRLEMIGRLLKTYKTVIHCGDPDDEGQLLIDEILDYYHYKGAVKRVLINDNLPENIRKAFQQLADNSKYRSLGDAAYARQMADLCFGVNHSRLATIRSKSVLVLGRVQSPTLALVVKRDMDIKNHVKQKYYELAVPIEIDGRTAEFMLKPAEKSENDENHILDRSVVEEAAKWIRAQKIFNPIKFENRIKVTAPPLPYNLTKLQGDMNKKYGYSLSRTLEITQKLRDKHKAITYNRSDCQYLKEEHFTMAPDVLPVIFENIGREFPVNYSIHSKCFDDGKISAHHGIIPQKKKVDLNALSKDERNVYEAIAERYIMQFLPPMQQKVCSAAISTEKGVLKYSSSTLVDPGFTEHFKDTDEKNEKKPFFKEGKYFGRVIDTKILEKETKAPARYTPKTLVDDMSSISKYVSDPKIKEALKRKDQGKEGENGSIGTVATRAAIVDSLVQRKYLEMSGKNIVSTPRGQALFGIMPPEVQTPALTAEWWLIQEDIKEGTRNVNDVMHSVVEEFRKGMNDMYKSEGNTAGFKAEKESFGNCPWCGSPVYKTLSKKTNQNVYYCSGYKEGCNFSLYQKTKRFDDTINLTDKKVKTLLSGKTITEELTSKAGKKYKAKLILGENEGANGKKYVNLNISEYVNDDKKSKR